jgi:hypothetical protein
MKILSIILCFSCLIPLTNVIGQPVVTDTAVLDQESTTNLLASSAGFAVANNYSIAQTFTAGMAGTLSSVNVAVWKGSSTTANLTMSIWSTGTSGFPLAELASSTVAASTISLVDQLVVVTFSDFSQAVTVRPGLMLAIRLASPALNAPPYQTRYDWSYYLPGQYAGGRSYIYGSTTLDQADTDFAFQTYVTPVPEPNGILLGLLSLSPLVSMRFLISPVKVSLPATNK